MTVTSIMPKFKDDVFGQIMDDGGPDPEATPFDQALAFTMSQEGGHVSREQAKRIGDRGGRTLWGFSERAYPHLDFDNFTKEQARELARRDYWDRIRGDELPPPVAFVLFDYAFHSGTGWAARELRTAVGLPAKGGLTPQVMRRVRQADPAELAKKILHQRAGFLALQGQKQPQFIKGWKKRLERNAWAAGKVAMRTTKPKSIEVASNDDEGRGI